MCSGFVIAGTIERGRAGIGCAGCSDRLLELAFHLHDVQHLVQEPGIHSCQLVHLIDGVPLPESTGNGKDPLVSRLGELSVQVLEGETVPGKTLGTHIQHPDGLLEHLLEGSPDGHHLTHGFHLRPKDGADLSELDEIPSRELEDDVIQGWLETGHGLPGHGIPELGEAVPQGKLGSDEGKGIPGGLGGKGRAPAQPGVHLDDPVILGMGVKGELDVALPHDTEMADDLDGDGTELEHLAGRKGLDRGHHHTFPGMDPHGIHVLHGTDHDAVVVAVPHHLVLQLLPSPEIFLDQYLAGMGECLAGKL